MNDNIFETIKNKIPKCQSYIFSEKKNKYALLIPVINEGERFVSQMNKMKENNIFNICDVFICDGGVKIIPQIPISLKIMVALDF